ncbi:DNA helicase [Tanacetum coccineum]
MFGGERVAGINSHDVLGSVFADNELRPHYLSSGLVSGDSGNSMGVHDVRGGPMVLDFKNYVLRLPCDKGHLDKVEVCNDGRWFGSNVVATSFLDDPYEIFFRQSGSIWSQDGIPSYVVRQKRQLPLLGAMKGCVSETSAIMIVVKVLRGHILILVTVNGRVSIVVQSFGYLVLLGAREYDLLSSEMLGAIVSESGTYTRTDYDVIIEPRDGIPQRVNKPHSSYMALLYMNRIGWISTGVIRVISGGSIFFGVYNAICRGDREGYEIGACIILPKTFTGGPRYMYSHYLDALAICRVLGNPQYFIIFTCNVNWTEIKRYMEEFPQLTPTDRADIVVRVFEQKFCTPSNSRNAASLIVTHPDGYRIVFEMMVHGPCGLANYDAVCMKDGKCGKKFTKDTTPTLFSIQRDMCTTVGEK